MLQESTRVPSSARTLIYPVVLWMLLITPVSAGPLSDRSGLSAKLPAPKQFGDFAAYLAGVGEDQQGRDHTLGLWIYPPEKFLTDRQRSNGTIRFPHLYHNDIVPMFGRIYRITKVSGGGRGSIEFERVSEQELPEGVTVKGRESFFIPRREDDEGVLDLHETSVSLVSVATSQKEDGFLVATIRLRPQVVDPKITFVKVKSGELLKVGEHLHKVRHIVPPDEKRQILGWVEIAPLPAKDAEGNPVTRQPEAPK